MNVFLGKNVTQYKERIQFVGQTFIIRMKTHVSLVLQLKGCIFKSIIQLLHFEYDSTNSTFYISLGWNLGTR